MYYYLLDLERTIGLGIATYWKQNRHGYTDQVGEAGLFSHEVAIMIVDRDFDKKTIMIAEPIVRKIAEI